MAEPIVQYRYKLRAAGPQQAEADTFYLQTFMVEKVRVDIYEAKKDTELLVTDNFRGRLCVIGEPTGEEDDCFISAQYQRLPYKDLEGDQQYSATEDHIPTYVDEEEIETP
jgi:hypothetical protein